MNTIPPTVMSLSFTDLLPALQSPNAISFSERGHSGLKAWYVKTSPMRWQTTPRNALVKPTPAQC